MTRSRIIGSIPAGPVAGGAATAFVIAWRPMIAAIDAPAPQPFVGSGETGQGPSAASLANAIANATGKRLRNLPLTLKVHQGGNRCVN